MKPIRNKKAPSTRKAKSPIYPYVVLEVLEKDAEELSHNLFSLGALGVETRDHETLLKNSTKNKTTLIANFETQAQAKLAMSFFPKTLSPRIEEVVGDDWKHSWKAFFKPVRCGKRFVIVPSWEKWAKKKNDIVIRMEPGFAFGTGQHETTRLVLTALDAWVPTQPQPKTKNLLDLGCGTGVLAIGALKLGLGSALAVDNDPLATTATKENAQKNRVPTKIKTQVGTASKVRGRFDLVLANIESRVLIPEAKAITSKVKKGGTLMLSGILAPEAKTVIKAYASLKFIRQYQENDWVALQFEQPDT